MCAGALDQEKLAALFGNGPGQRLHLGQCEAVGRIDYEQGPLVDLEAVERIGGLVLGRPQQLAGVMSELEGPCRVHPQFESLEGHALDTRFLFETRSPCPGQGRADNAIASLLPDLAGAGQGEVLVLNRESGKGLDPTGIAGEVAKDSPLGIGQSELGLAGDVFEVCGPGVLSHRGSYDLANVVFEFFCEWIAGFGETFDGRFGDSRRYEPPGRRSHPPDGL